jgi:hypothetical protein
MKEITTETSKYILCHNNIDVIHCVLLKKGNILSTEQEFIEEFSTIELLKARVNEIVGDEEYFDLNFSSNNF